MEKTVDFYYGIVCFFDVQRENLCTDKENLDGVNFTVHKVMK